MNIGAAIRDARVHAGLSQQELARRGGTSQATLSAYENGRKTPSVTTLARVLAVAGVRLHAVPKPSSIVVPTREQHEQAGRTLREVIELAETLPTRHEPTLRFPRLGSHRV